MAMDGRTNREIEQLNTLTLRTLSIIGNELLIKVVESLSLERFYNRWLPDFGLNFLNTRPSTLLSSLQAGWQASKPVITSRGGKSMARQLRSIQCRWSLI